MRVGAGRLFGVFYLALWCAAFAALILFMADIPRYAAIVWALALLFLAPDFQTVWRLLSGKEDEDRSDT